MRAEIREDPFDSFLAIRTFAKVIVKSERPRANQHKESDKDERLFLDSKASEDEASQGEEAEEHHRNAPLLAKLMSDFIPP